MSRIRTLAALVAAAGLAPGMMLSAPALAQANCDWYATTALKQQQENEKYKCGFSGPEWNSDKKAHMAWCASVTPDRWRESAQRREKDLQACAAKKKG